MMMATTLRHLDQLLHTVERGRALNVDELGRLPVRLYGPDGQPLFTEQNPAHVKGEVTLTGQNVADGSPVEGPSYAVDPDGYGALRVVDAAPHGLDPGLDAYRVVDRSEVEIETIFDGQVPPEGGEMAFYAPFQGERHAIFLVVSDQPWRLLGGTIYYPEGTFSRIFYPEIGRVDNDPTTNASPKMAIYLGAPTTSTEEPQSWGEAMKLAFPTRRQETSFLIRNLGSSEAAVTIRLLRVF